VASEIAGRVRASLAGADFHRIATAANRKIQKAPNSMRISNMMLSFNVGRQGEKPAGPRARVSCALLREGTQPCAQSSSDGALYGVISAVPAA
jgi:hypothetical protein